MLPGVSNYFATSAALMEYMRSTECHSGCLIFFYNTAYASVDKTNPTQVQLPLALAARCAAV